MLKARDVWDEQEDRKEKRMRAMRPVLSQLYGQIRKQAVHSPMLPILSLKSPRMCSDIRCFRWLKRVSTS